MSSLRGPTIAGNRSLDGDDGRRIVHGQGGLRGVGEPGRIARLELRHPRWSRPAWRRRQAAGPACRSPPGVRRDRSARSHVRPPGALLPQRAPWTRAGRSRPGSSSRAFAQPPARIAARHVPKRSRVPGSGISSSSSTKMAPLALRASPRDDCGHLVTYVDGGAKPFERHFHDLDGAIDAGAEPARRSQQDRQGGRETWGVGVERAMKRRCVRSWFVLSPAWPVVPLAVECESPGSSP